jgi:hypothetical protein
MTYRPVESRHFEEAGAMMREAAGPIPTDALRLGGSALVVRALVTARPDQRPDDEIVQSALSVALANGWDREEPHRFAGRLGTLAWRQWNVQDMLEQATLRTIDPGKVDHGAVVGLPGATMDEAGRRDAERTLDEIIADPVRRRDDLAMVEGRLHQMTPTRQASLAADLDREQPLRSGRRLIAAYEETLATARRIDEENHPLDRFERIMVEKAKEAIAEVAFATGGRATAHAEEGRKASRSNTETHALMVRTSLRFDEDQMRQYNRALLQRTGASSPGEETEREMARHGVAIDPVAEREWRMEAMAAARRHLQLEGVPPHLQPEGSRQTGNVDLPMTSQYDQRTMPDRLRQAATELGVTPSMMATIGEMAPVARVLHLHAPQALAIAEEGAARMPERLVGPEAFHADAVEHMGRGDFDQARHDLARARSVAAWLAPRCSASTRELMGLDRTDGRSQMAALLVEAERRVAPEPIGAAHAARGAAMTPAMQAAARSAAGRGMA